MKKANKKREPRKELSTAVLLILVLLFTVTFLGFGICIGFLINAVINESIDNILVSALYTLIVGIVYFVLLTRLMFNSDSENVQPLKWYINNILISLTLNFIITAITVFTLQPGDGVINYLVGLGIFPLIGIITTINIVKYVKKDTTKWKNIFYKNGNLDHTKKTEEYFRVKTPVSFEKKILSAIYKEQILNILVVVGIMIIITTLGLHHLMKEQIYTDNIISNIIAIRAERAFGLIFFMMVLFAAFGIPIVAFYIANFRKKIRIVKNHEYIAYHAIVSGVHNSRINIYGENKHYTYKYCTCVGIREKDIHSTPATLIFIPDDVLLFPDNEEYKVEKKEK